MQSADEILLSAIEAAEGRSYGSEDGDLSSERATSIDYYLGKPLGNEIDGRSQVVSRDVADTIEWIKPSLLRIFTGTDEICRFIPRGPEDELAAEQETDYINYVLTQKNNWFAICYEWFTDALLTKNAYALAYWDEKRDTTTETYEGISDDQLALLMSDPEVQITDMREARQIVVEDDGSKREVIFRDVSVRRAHAYGCVRIDVLPPERCLVSQHTKSYSLQDADFFEYWEMVTISRLREMGFDVPDDIVDEPGSADESEDHARNVFGESISPEAAADPSMRMVRARMCWIKHDYDGDGLAEYRYVVLVGRNILANREASRIPVACIVPTPMPHRHIGLSIADQVRDLQEIKTVMMRQIVDNTYLQNNGRYAISDKVDIDDLLTSRPGAPVRVDGIPAQEIVPLTHPFIAPQALAVVDYIDQVRENRTGTNRYFTGIDQNALNRTASGIAQLTSSAAQRVEMIARIIADGVRELFSIVHELTLKHGRQSETVRLRGKWVTVDPRQWTRRYDMAISVGVGTGNKEQLAANVINILLAQERVLPLGIATPQTIYNALAELTKAYGFSSPEKFWREPKQDEPLPPDPAKIAEEQKAIAEAQKKQDDLAFQRAKHQAEYEHALRMRELEYAHALRMAELDQAKERTQMESEATREQLRQAIAVEDAKLTIARNAAASEAQAAAKLDTIAADIKDGIAQLAQAQAAMMAGIERVAQLVTADRETEVVRDPKTGKVMRGRSRLIMPEVMQ